MKKLLVMLVILSLFLAFSSQASADGAKLLWRISEPSEDGKCEAVLEADGVEDVAVMQLSLFYDPDVLCVVRAEVGNLFTGNLAPTINTQFPGEIHLTWDSLTPLSGSGPILLLQLQSIGSDESVLRFDADELLFAREDYLPLNVEYSDGLIKGTTGSGRLPQPAAGDSSSQAEPAGTSAAAGQMEHPASDDALTKGSSRALTIVNSPIALSPGDAQTMTVLEDAGDLIWSSSNEQVATVDNCGTVTAHEEGAAVITVSSEDGLSYASGIVTVVKKDGSAPTSPEGPTNTEPAEEAPDRSPAEDPIPDETAEDSQAEKSDLSALEGSSENVAGRYAVIMLLLAVGIIALFLFSRKRASRK